MKSNRMGLLGKPKFDHNSVRARFASAMQQGASTKNATAFANSAAPIKRELTQLQPPPGDLKPKKAAARKAAKKRAAKKKAAKKAPAPEGKSSS